MLISLASFRKSKEDCESWCCFTWYIRVTIPAIPRTRTRIALKVALGLSQKKRFSICADILITNEHIAEDTALIVLIEVHNLMGDVRSVSTDSL